MLAARLKFSPRTIPSIFSRSARSKKRGYSILVLPKTESVSKFSVVLSSTVTTSAIRRHKIKRETYQHLAQWIATGEPADIEKSKTAFYLIVMIMNWQQAQAQLRTQDWKETVEYLLVSDTA